MILRRQIGTEVIYPHPTTFIYAQKESKCCLIIFEKSLLNSSNISYEIINLNDSNSVGTIHVDSCMDDKSPKVVELMLFTEQSPNRITLYAKNDYHYRDFVGAIEM